MSELINGTPAPAPGPTPPLPPKAKRTWLWITLGAIVAPMVLGAVLALLVSNGTADAAPTPSATQTAESADEVEPAVETVEPEPPAAEQGTFENPYPAGFEYIISDLTADVEVFTVSARLVPVAEQNEVLGGAEAKAAPEGMRNEIVEYTVTGLDPNKLVNPGMEAINWKLVDQDDTNYDAILVMTDGTGEGELPAGETWVGQALFHVPAGTTELYFSAYGSYTAL